jgi:TonB family protein
VGVCPGWRIRALLTAIAFAILVPPGAAQDPWTPARFDQGASPSIPQVAVAGGEVFLELTVTGSGAVDRADVLRTTPPFTDVLLGAVRGWRFRPAERRTTRIAGGPPGTVTARMTEAVEAKVLVAAVYRPPSMQTPTLGEPPRNISSPTAGVAYPLTTITPGFPPRALSDGVVLLEVGVGTDGRVTDATVLRSDGGFDQAALDAVRLWTFQPARVDGQVEETYAYVVMAFRQPITTSQQPPAPPR